MCSSDLVDETEAGNFLEVEGPSPEAVESIGRQLGFSKQDYVRRTYAELIGEPAPQPSISLKESL